MDSAINNMIAAAKRGNIEAGRELFELLVNPALKHIPSPQTLADISLALDAAPELRPLYEDTIRELVRNVSAEAPKINDNTNAEMMTRYFLSPKSSAATKRLILDTLKDKVVFVQVSTHTTTRREQRGGYDSTRGKWVGLAEDVEVEDEDRTEYTFSEYLQRFYRGGLEARNKTS